MSYPYRVLVERTERTYRVVDEGRTDSQGRRLVAETWEPPRCAHGHIVLGCPHDDCPTQVAFLDWQEAAMAAWERRQQEAARHLVRRHLGQN